MLFLTSLPRSFRLLEWIFLLAYLGMAWSTPGINWSRVLIICGIVFSFSWTFPQYRLLWQRWSYIVLSLLVLIVAQCFGVDLALFPYICFGKSYFLLGRQSTVTLIIITAIPWVASQYLGATYRLQLMQFEMLGLNPDNLIKFVIVNLAIYTAASIYTMLFTAMLVKQQKDQQKIKELSEQVESLAATLERTRIAREIHDSLGHTLTDLDTQLAVAQTLRSQKPEQAFHAIDTAKLLARQCIEDVSQALARMRQSDFDLNQAIVLLLEQLRQTSSLQIHWKVDLPYLPIYQSYQIYCVIKEGLMNVQKHAQASQVSLFAYQTSEGIAIDLKDNGIGFALEAFNPGFGLQGMIERVQLLGGQLDIKTAFTQGTQLHISLPL